MSKKPKETPYDMLKEYVNDYIKYMEKINKKREDAAQKEFNWVMQEIQAFNILRQNIHTLETNGVS